MARIAIIGGTGLEDPDIFKGPEFKSFLADQ